VQVVITPESKSRERNRWIVNELVELHKQYLDGRLPVYDGKKGLFTVGPLSFKIKEFVLKLTNPERANHGYNFCFSYKNMFFYVFIFFNNGIEFQPLQSVYSQKIITKQSHPRSNWGKIKGK